MNSRLVRTLDDLDGLAAAWKALEPAARLPTQGFAWARACAGAFHASRGVEVVAVDGAVAPLARRNGRLELLGLWEISEPSDVLARNEAALAALAEALVRTGCPLRLARVPAASPTVPALREAYRGRGGLSVRPQDGSPFIRLDDGWRDPLGRISARRRADLHRAAKRAQGSGPLRYEVLAPAPGEVEPVLDVAWAVEDRSWRAAREGTLSRDALRGPFFRAWARRAAGEGTLRVALMYAGEEAIAMQLATVCAGGYWLLKVGYDEAWSRASPGVLLMVETIRRAAEEGLATYELMGVVEPWTSVWTEDVREAVTIRTYPFSPRGAKALVGDSARAARARLARRSS